MPLEEKGQGQIFLNSVLQLITGTQSSFILMVGDLFSTIVYDNEGFRFTLNLLTTL